MTNTELLAKIKAEIERKRAYNQRNASPEGAGAFYEDERILSFLSTLESEKPMQEGLEEELDRFIASGKSVTVDDYGTYKVSYHDFKKVARHFAEWQKEQDDRLADIIYQQGIEKGKDEMKEQLVSDDLEEAADEYEKKHTYQRYDGGGLTPEYNATLAEAFIAGAKWQKERNKPRPTEDLVDYAYRRYPICNRRIETTKDANDDLRDGFLEGVDWQKSQMMKEAVEGYVNYYEDSGGILMAEAQVGYPYHNGDKVRIIIVKEDEK